MNKETLKSSANWKSQYLIMWNNTPKKSRKNIENVKNIVSKAKLYAAIYLEGTGWVMPKTINKLNEDGVPEPTMVYEPIESMNKKNYANGGNLSEAIYL